MRAEAARTQCTAQCMPVAVRSLDGQQPVVAVAGTPRQVLGRGIRHAQAACCRRVNKRLLHVQPQCRCWLPRLPLCNALQTAKGKEARGVTTQEWHEHVLEKMLVEQRIHARKHPENYKKGLWVSFDNAKCHSPGNLLCSARPVVHRLPLMPRSPDVHKVPEHVVNTLNTAANKYFYDHPTVREIRREFKAPFFRVVTAEVVRKDIETLPKTDDIVRHSRKDGGTAGDWPPKRYRSVNVSVRGAVWSSTALCIGACPPLVRARLLALSHLGPACAAPTTMPSMPGPAPPAAIA